MFLNQTIFDTCSLTKTSLYLNAFKQWPIYGLHTQIILKSSAKTIWEELTKLENHKINRFVSRMTHLEFHKT